MAPASCRLEIGGRCPTFESSSWTKRKLLLSLFPIRSSTLNLLVSAQTSLTAPSPDLEKCFKMAAANFSSWLTKGEPFSDIILMSILQKTPSFCSQWWKWCWIGVNISLASAQKLRYAFLVGRGLGFFLTLILAESSWNCMTQVSIGEVVLLCKEIRETLIDLTVENRLTLRERNFKTVDCWNVLSIGRFFLILLEGFFIGCWKVLFIGRFV